MHCMTTSRPAAATQIRGKVSPAMHSKVFVHWIPFLWHPSLYPVWGPAQNMLVCIPRILSINIRFLSEQYLSGTLFLKPASTRIPSPHSSRSSIMRPERCAVCTPPHRRDTRKWSDDYCTRTRTRTDAEAIHISCLTVATCCCRVSVLFSRWHSIRHE